jgi:hypothetical protein
MVKVKVEAEKVAKFLLDLQLRTKRSQLVVTGTGGKKFPVNCEYILGTNLHLAVLSNKDKILKMIPEMNAIKDLNGLCSI